MLRYLNCMYVAHWYQQQQPNMDPCLQKSSSLRKWSAPLGASWPTQGAAEDEQQKKAVCRYQFHLLLEVVGELFLRPTDDSDTFLPGPGVTMTLTKQREERKVHGARPSKMVTWLPKKGCHCEKSSSRTTGPLIWNYMSCGGLDYRWNGRVGRNTSVCSYISHYNINSSRHVLGTLYVLASTITKRTIHRYIILSSFCGWKIWGSKVGN